MLGQIVDDKVIPIENRYASLIIQCLSIFILVLTVAKIMAVIALWHIYYLKLFYSVSIGDEGWVYLNQRILFARSDFTRIISGFFFKPTSENMFNHARVCRYFQLFKTPICQNCVIGLVFKFKAIFSLIESS